MWEGCRVGRLGKVRRDGWIWSWGWMGGDMKWSIGMGIGEMG